jgi:hypothetical protein
MPILALICPPLLLSSIFFQFPVPAQGDTEWQKSKEIAALFCFFQTIACASYVYR